MLKAIKKIIRLETATGISLFIATIVAIILSNSAASDWYQAFINSTFSFEIKSIYLSKTFLFFVNDGLMAIFFLTIGLELKREFFFGELCDISHVVLPALAAIGGMLIPSLIYILFNFSNPDTLAGWAIPVATDIAFALGVLSLFSSRVPIQLKLFLLTLAIIDDIGAIIIIAFFYTASINFFFLTITIIIVAAAWLLNLLIGKKLWPFILIGIVLWVCVLNTGVHPTLAGILLALVIPINANPHHSPLHKLEEHLTPWVGLLIMPLFAFCNAGVSFSDISLDALINTISLGIIIGLFVGKPVGIVLFSWLTISLKWARLPRYVTWLDIYGVALICGIGFTMSLFLGILAFGDSASLSMKFVKIGVLFGSLLSGLLGSSVLLYTYHLKKSKINQ